MKGAQIKDAMREAPFTRSDPADLIHVAVENLVAENLVKGHFELPAFTTLIEPKLLELITGAGR
jgi:hypothetical protein